MFGANCVASMYKQWGATWRGFDCIASYVLSLSEARVLSLSLCLLLTLRSSRV
jgi:hypothetical protein